MTLPHKCIKSGADVALFRQMKSFQVVIHYLELCCSAVLRTPRSKRVHEEASIADPMVQFFVLDFFVHLRQMVAEIPLQDMRLQRFGNKAFTDFLKRLAEELPGLLERLLPTLPGTAAMSESAKQDLNAEIAEYLKDAFGNLVRIDYGTGHELHFFIALILCLQQFGDRVETDTVLLQDVVFHVFWEYIRFMRLLQSHYKLEPAGSHGVWGLDDYHHIPFIFGAAQLVDMDEETVNCNGCGPVKTADACNAQVVEKLKEDFFYFNAIAWINKNKSGNFHEHSPVLYNISGVPRWQKVMTGMIKMYAAEVMSKFAVVQHLLFGAHFPFE